MGAAYQFANDMSYGAFDAFISLSVDAFAIQRQNDTFQQGREDGRNASKAVGTTMAAHGTYMTISGLTAMGPTAGGSLAAAVPTGGTTILAGGAALTAEGIFAIGGAVEAGYGIGILSYAKMNPVGGTKNLPNKYLTIHQGRQGKHIPRHNNYQPGKSILTHNNPQALLDQYSGTGTPLRGTYGKPGYRERVDFGFDIGQYIDPVTGKQWSTTNGIIHYSRNGAHIVPARP